MFLHLRLCRCVKTLWPVNLFTEDEETQDPEVYTDANIATCYDYHPRGFTVYSVDIYSSHNVSTWTKCESLCSGDDTCRSYSYDTGGAEVCLLSTTTTYVAGCATCTFGSKEPCEASMILYATLLQSPMSLIFLILKWFWSSKWGFSFAYINV